MGDGVGLLGGEGVSVADGTGVAVGAMAPKRLQAKAKFPRTKSARRTSSGPGSALKRQSDRVSS
jgi:hypothetical protein